MKTFLAVYTGSPDAFVEWNKLPAEQRQQREAEGMRAWMEWGAKHAAVIVDQGGPLGKTKRADAKGISDTRNNLAGYVIVRAETHEAAAKLFERHPHFTSFPGEAVEIVECLPMPR
jgi:hypothetical protein